MSRNGGVVAIPEPLRRLLGAPFLLLLLFLLLFLLLPAKPY
ncbi:hypothetical protein ACIO7M_12435 [Streptomyces toxytricini]|uniref:ABC transporter permease n=1 Tax=Streptomyces toxytricini TaxID=67369 RepID=A0ABW8EF89_STRT5